MPYVVVSPITYLGRSYAAGEAIEPKVHVAGQLVAAGCIKEVPPPVPTSRPPAKPVSGVHIAPLVKPLAKD